MVAQTRKNTDNPHQSPEQAVERRAKGTRPSWRAFGASPGDVAYFMSIAPELGMELVRHPELAEAISNPDAPRSMASILNPLLAETSDIEVGMRMARQAHRQAYFGVVADFVIGKRDRFETASSLSDLADAAICAMAELSQSYVRRRWGELSARWAIFALGKSAGRDMTATSDLDLMIVYDSPVVDAGEQVAKFAQTFVKTVSQRNETGRLYDVDLRLRPFGESGPVAVKLDAFRKYYALEAWTWELMALTRLRPICGDPALQEDVMSLRDLTLVSRSGEQGITTDVRDMRQRMKDQKPAQTVWDMKLSEGGLLDIEFIVQELTLKLAGQQVLRCSPNTREALKRMQTAEILQTQEAQILLEAEAFQSLVQQAQARHTPWAFDRCRIVMFAMAVGGCAKE